MISELKTVDEFLYMVPADRKEVLQTIRNLCLKHLKGYEESMAYKMPCYAKNEIVEVAFNSQKNYISLYILKKEVLDKHRAHLSHLNVGKGCIRYNKPEQLEFEIIEKLLKDTVTSSTSVC